MISLAGRDILHSWGKFVSTGVGLGLLIGVTLSMAGIYRGMVDDAQVMLDNTGADLWVVQQGTQGPYAESSSLYDDLYRSLLNMPGVEYAANVTYLIMQVGHGDQDVSSMVVGITAGKPGTPGQPRYLVAGRHITRSHYEAIADISSGFQLGERIRIRRNFYTVVGLSKRTVSYNGDPMVFIPLKDAQEAQFLKDNDALVQQRRRNAENPAFNRPGIPDLLAVVNASQSSNTYVNAILVKLKPGTLPEDAAEPIRRWMRLQVYTRTQMESILMDKVIDKSARQIALFLVILSIVSAAIVAFIIYTLTLGKIREIAVLKLIGTKNRTIAGMIMQQSLALGTIGFVVGKITATAAADAAAQGSLQSVQRQYGLGAASYVQQLIAQQAAQQTKIDLIAAQAQRLVDSAALYQAMGEGVN
ncbi:ABC transporter permease [Methylotuvimicrobium sp. KM2]|uniref:ABC transporter permease n=1 Tax=Methylotuvimicrobium sp. KM2 TaxID=3133976 RepID=UPI0031014CE7